MPMIRLGDDGASAGSRLQYELERAREWAAQHKGPVAWAAGAAALVVWTWLCWLIFSGGVPLPTGDDFYPDYALPKNHSNSLYATLNTTLGFQKLLVVNVPSRTDRSDKMSVMGAATDIHFDFLRAPHEDDVPDEVMPPNAKGWTGKVRASWRGHIDALRHVVDNNLTTAVIFEDDLDWDVRLKKQLYDYARTTLALTQPLKGKDAASFADPTFPNVKDANLQPTALDFRRLPETVPPTFSPYGDNWDLLWLGHCGMAQPKVMKAGEPSADTATKLPKGYVVHTNDKTVPSRRNLHWWVDHIYHFKNDFPDHARVTYHAMDAVCNFAYAITQRAAQRILFELGIRGMNDPYDLMLRDWCHSARGHEDLGGICLTAQPSFFSHFIPQELKEGEEGDADPPFERTKNIRYSTWGNLPALLRGEDKFEDQWPD